MGSDVVFGNPYLDKCLRFGWYLDITMLLLLGDISLMFRPNSVADMDDRDCTFDDGWSNVVWFFWSTIYLMPYWGIFPFWLRFINLHGLHDHLHLWDTHQDDDLFVNLSWSPSGAAFGPFSHAHIFWCLDVLMILLLRYTFWYVDLIQLWTWMTRITHLVMDD